MIDNFYNFFKEDQAAEALYFIVSNTFGKDGDPEETENVIKEMFSDDMVDTIDPFVLNNVVNDANGIIAATILSNKIIPDILAFLDKAGEDIEIMVISNSGVFGTLAPINPDAVKAYIENETPTPINVYLVAKNGIKNPKLADIIVNLVDMDKEEVGGSFYFKLFPLDDKNVRESMSLLMQFINRIFRAL